MYITPSIAENRFIESIDLINFCTTIKTRFKIIFIVLGTYLIYKYRSVTNKYLHFYSNYTYYISHVFNRKLTLKMELFLI